MKESRKAETGRKKTKRTQTPARLVHYENLHAHNAAISLQRPAFLAAAKFYAEINGEALTLSELAHRLNEAGHRTPRGRFFDVVAVTKLKRKIAELNKKNQSN